MLAVNRLPAAADTDRPAVRRRRPPVPRPSRRWPGPRRKPTTTPSGSACSPWEFSAACCWKGCCSPKGSCPGSWAAYGLAGYAIFLAGAILEILGHNVGVALSIPGGLFEIAFGVLLIAKGFPAGQSHDREGQARNEPLATTAPAKAPTLGRGDAGRAQRPVSLMDQRRPHDRDRGDPVGSDPHQRCLRVGARRVLRRPLGLREDRRKGRSSAASRSSALTARRTAPRSTTASATSTTRDWRSKAM